MTDEYDGRLPAEENQDDGGGGDDDEAEEEVMEPQVREPRSLARKRRESPKARPREFSPDAREEWFRRSQYRDPRSYSSEWDDDTPSWPMYLGICLWILMGITLIFVWYDENYGIWDEIPGLKEPEAMVQVNSEMMGHEV
eukprot:TRINITY_DN8820_c0_g1_i1.p1 TRINITY_DN8820_c0_g1~~TRINITY_DN8820_c0_g1_i1.p1  ORF type:complete len:140 (+),score=32.13 TRINITY_DN8820_c0_g1_i1:107-526(+)